jgi:hypothetical protein
MPVCQICTFKGCKETGASGGGSGGGSSGGGASGCGGGDPNICDYCNRKTDVCYVTHYPFPLTYCEVCEMNNADAKAKADGADNTKD